MGSRFGSMVAVVLVLSTASTAFAELTEEEKGALREAREQACERLAKLQREDGSWQLNPEHPGPWDAALTALVTHAIYQNRTGKFYENARRGLAWITQRAPDGKPLADALTAICLTGADPRKYVRLLDLRLMTLAAARIRPGDPAESLFLACALEACRNAGAQFPQETWQRARKDFLEAQNDDGSWTVPPEIAKGRFLNASAEPDRSFATVTGATALVIVRGALRREGEKDEELDAAIDKAFDWLAKNPKKEYAPFEWRATERLGYIGGYGEFGGRPWRPALRDAMLKRIANDADMSASDLAFALLALRDADIPVVIGKLRTRIDWDACRDDVRRLVVDYVSSRFCYPLAWQIVSLDTDPDYLSRIPILYLSGSKALDFTDAESKKLRDYVDKSGTILAANTGDGDAFDKSLRALVAELWPDRPFRLLDEKHMIYTVPRPIRKWKPEGGIAGLVLPAEREIVGLVYISDVDFARLLSQGGDASRGACDLGANIYFHARKMVERRAAAEAEGK